MADVLQRIASNLYNGENKAVAELVQEALDGDMAPEEILAGALIAGMDEVGKDFKAGELFVPEVLIAARAMHAGMDILRPLLAEGDALGAGKYVIGTVKGDLHDIGKNLVKMMMEGAGFNITDLGVDVSPEKFVEKAQEMEPDIVAMSALLSTTMPAMLRTIKALNKAGIRDKVKVMIGGAPVTERYAIEIEADGYAPDAGSAISKAKALLGVS